MVAINIIGTVGAGKTTLAKKLQSATNLPVGYEANSEKLTKETRDLLVKYYENPKKYALEKNLFFLKQRENTLLENKQYDAYISDRFLYDDFLMALLNVRNEQMSEDEWDTYLSAFDQVESKFYPETDQSQDVVIFIKPSFEQTLDQIQKRGRKEEQVSSNPDLKEYYKTMYDMYIEIFSKWEATPKITINSVDDTDINELIMQIKSLQPDLAEFM